MRRRALEIRSSILFVIVNNNSILIKPSLCCVLGLGIEEGNYFLSCYDSEDIEAFVRKVVEKEPCQVNTWVS